MTISAALIVKNEEHCLRQCLESLREVADEIVVADTGSDDRSVEIASELASRVCSFEWVDDFARARNFALEHATGDYILHIDADECILDPGQAGALLRGFAGRHEDNVVGTVCIVSATGTGPDANETVDHLERFFRRGRFQYEGAIHEQLVPLEGDKRSAPTGVRCSHSGYVRAPGEPSPKSLRNKRLLLKELERHPSDEYYLHKLGKAHMGLDEHAEACAAFERALTAIRFEPGKPPQGRMGAVAPGVLTDLVVSLAYSYANADQLDKALAHVETHEALGHPGVLGADFQHVAGYIHLMQGDVARSREAYLESLRRGPQTGQVLGTGSFASLYHLGLLCEAGRDIGMAVAYYVRALEAKPDHAPTIARCIALITEHRMALPAEVWHACGRKAFIDAFIERLKAFLLEGDREHFDMLVASTRDSAPELHERCVGLSWPDEKETGEASRE